MGKTPSKPLSKCPKCKVRIPPGTKLKPYCEKCGFTFPVAKEPVSLKALGIAACIVGLGLLGALIYFTLPAAKPVRVDVPRFKSFISSQPPELTTDGVWVDVANKTSLAGLKGKVVWLEFTNVASAKTSAQELQLNRWAENFGADGLSIVTMFSGPEEEKVGSGISEVKKFYQNKRTQQLVMFDPHGTTFKAYGIDRTPSSYLIDKEGNVAWEGFQNMTTAEMKIREELAK